MKSGYTLLAAALLAYLIGGIVARIGEWAPGYEIDAGLAATGALLLGAFFALGYGAGLSERTK